jgi:uncharacterized membrane-anchored protein YitT (DUF2179 family)
MKKPFRLHYTLEEGLYTLFGAGFAAFALKGFLVPNQFFDGGMTGIALLLHELFHWNIAYVIVLVNAPLLILGGYLVNWSFAIKAFLSVVLLGLCLVWIEFPVITSDKLLIAIFGGFFIGLGIGLGMRGGAVLDGIEILALYTWRRTGFTMSEIILALNVVIFLIAAFGFGLETMLYSMLTYFVATRTIDYVVEGLEEYTGVTIVSGKAEEIKHKLVMEMGRGITVYKGERGYLKQSFERHSDCDIIFTVITRLQVRQLHNAVHHIDPTAFIFTNSIKEAAGGVLKKKASH